MRLQNLGAYGTPKGQERIVDLKLMWRCRLISVLQLRLQRLISSQQKNNRSMFPFSSHRPSTRRGQRPIFWVSDRATSALCS